MADARGAGAFAFVDSATRLQAVGSRLGALAELVERQLGALVERLDTLPAATGFDPFLAGARGAAVAAIASATEAPVRSPRKAPVPPASAAPREPQEGPSLGSAVARGFAVGTLVSGAVDDLLARIAVGGGGPARARAAAAKPGARPALPIDANPLEALLKQASAQARQAVAVGTSLPSPSSLPAAALQGAGAIGQAVLDLANGVIGQRKPALAQPPAPISAGGAQALGALPASLLIEIQLAALAAAAKSTARQGSPRPGSRDAVASPSAAPRAPSRLFGSEAAAVIDATKPAATPPVRGNVPLSATEAPREEDVVAVINRMLVDQAWLRGVDLR